MQPIKKFERDFWTEIFKLQKQGIQIDVEDLMNQFYTAAFRDHSVNTKQKNQDNQRCLHHLIPKQVEIVESDMSIRNGPTGIKNLGATCYLNSFLQIWFHNILFRDAIYRYKVKANDVQRNIAGILQYVFTELELTNKKFIDVHGLVKALDVSPCVQQDSLEFSKLLLSLLESILAQSTDIKSELFGQYQGEFVYNTTCRNCLNVKSKSSVFDELRIYLSENHSLEDGIRSLLLTEHLTGDNRYMCDTCHSKQDATRSTKLGILPQVFFSSRDNEYRPQSVQVRLQYPNKEETQDRSRFPFEP
jgi:ubiquitin C-terminal hydrolase